MIVEVGLVFGDSVATGCFHSETKLVNLLDEVFPHFWSNDRSLSRLFFPNVSENFVTFHHSGVEVSMHKTLGSFPRENPVIKFGGRKVVFAFVAKSNLPPETSVELHLVVVPARPIAFVFQKKFVSSVDSDKMLCIETVVCEGEARPTDTLWSVFSQAHVKKSSCYPSKLDFEVEDESWDSTFDCTDLKVWTMRNIANGKVAIVRKSPVDMVMTVVERVPDKFFVVGKVQAPKVSPGSVDALEKLCSKSLVGKGRKTVYDETVRKSLEIVPGDECLVDWIGLDQALEMTSKVLMQGRKLRAEIYKVLLYREGDFFEWHRDSKKAEGHLLTMCVDAGMDTEYKGGDLVFRSDRSDEDEDEELHSDSDEEKVVDVCERWSSTGGGSFACFFATQPHAVRLVTEGHRVIITYNIFVDDEGPIEILRPGRSALMSVIPAFASVGPDISWHILEFLDLQSLSRLMQTSKSLAQTGTRPEFLLGLFLRNRHVQLMHALQKENSYQMGMVLAHQYSFDGKQSIPWNQIRGRDAICVSAMRFAFGDKSLETTTCLVRHERLEDNQDPGYYSICKASSENFDHFDQELEYEEIMYLPVEVPEELRHLLFPGCTKIERNSMRSMNRTETECDRNSDEMCLSWPFFFTSFITSSSFLAQVSHGQIVQQESDLYGNSRQFNLFWYKDAIMLIKLLPPPPPPDILTDEHFGFH